MNKLSMLLTASVASVLSAAAASAQTAEQTAEQQTERAYEQSKQAARATYQEGKQEAKQAWQETKEEAHEAAQSVDSATERTRTAAVTSDEDREDRAEDLEDARKQVTEATKVVQQMKQDKEMTRLLQQARGVFIMPNYGKAAAVVGGRGGEGVLLLSGDGKWSNPAFYNFGRASIGAQAGASAGSVAMVLMTDKAVGKFEQDDNWALDATAGLTIVNYTADARGTAKSGDVIVWSDSKGLFAGASLGVSDIARDDSENAAYYKKAATPQQIFGGAVQNPHARPLQNAMPQVASR